MSTEEFETITTERTSNPITGLTRCLSTFPGPCGPSITSRRRGTGRQGEGVRLTSQVAPDASGRHEETANQSGPAEQLG